MSVHGSANVDCVTVWFFERNSKRTVSPTAAATLVGLNSKPVSPTRTVMLAAEATAAQARARARVEKCIVFSIRDQGQGEMGHCVGYREGFIGKTDDEPREKGRIR
jgi:hypothetical protein